jgi:hypothetical protein
MIECRSSGILHPVALVRIRWRNITEDGIFSQYLTSTVIRSEVVMWDPQCLGSEVMRCGAEAAR